MPEGDNGHWKVVDGVIDYDAAERGRRRQEPLDREASTATSSCGSTGASRRRRTSTRTCRIILPDGTHKKDADGKEIKISRRPTPTRASTSAGSAKSQVNIWCWPIGSGEVYGYRMDAKMPPDVRAGVTPKTQADKPVGEWNTFEITCRATA